MLGGHLDVDHGEIRAPGLDEAQQDIGVAGHADHLEAALGEQPRQTVPQQRFVVGDHDAHGSSVRSWIAPSAPERADAILDLHEVARARGAHLDYQPAGRVRRTHDCPRRRAGHGGDQEVPARLDRCRESPVRELAQFEMRAPFRQHVERRSDARVAQRCRVEVMGDRADAFQRLLRPRLGQAEGRRGHAVGVDALQPIAMPARRGPAERRRAGRTRAGDGGGRRHRRSRCGRTIVAPPRRAAVPGAARGRPRDVRPLEVRDQALVVDEPALRRSSPHRAHTRARMSGRAAPR